MFFIGITTYGKIQNVIDQVENIYTPENEYLIHYNKREKRKDFKELKKYFAGKKNIKVYSKYRVYWGHYSILKSCIYMQKHFLKSNKEIFIHLDAKTCNVIDAKDLFTYILEKNNNGYNFFGSGWKNICKTYELKKFYGELPDDNKMDNKAFFFFKKKWFFLKWYKKSTTKFYFYIISFFLFFVSMKKFKDFLYFISLFFKSIFLNSKIAKENFNTFLLCLINKNFHPSNSLSFILSKKDKKLPKKLLHLNKIFFNKSGGLLVINKKDLIKIYNSKDFNNLFKFLRNLASPEEWFFEWLFFNKIESNNTKSINLFFYLQFDINKINNKNEINNLNDEKICFIRRLEGKKEIDRAKNLIK